MTLLWNMLLRSDLPEDLFDELYFATFGLGDTAYEKFCWPAKKLTRRMEKLGATRIHPTGEGDDQHPLGYARFLLQTRVSEICTIRLDGALEPWITGLVNSLLELLPLPEGLESLPSDYIFPSRVSLKKTSVPDSFEEPLDSDPAYHDATVKTNIRITAKDWYQDVRHLEFDFEDDIQYVSSIASFSVTDWSPRYSPGDIAIIHPQTHPDDVEMFLSSMGWGNIADEPYLIERNYDGMSSLP